MIFHPDLAAMVLDGRKTQTRRPVKPGEIGCRYTPGREYAVQEGRGQRQVGRLTVTAVRREPLRAVTDDDAHREGFPSRQAFLARWEGLHGRVDLDRDVWVIDFEASAVRPHLTRSMRDALIASTVGPLRRTLVPGETAVWPAPVATVRALERRGLLAHAVRRNRHGHVVHEWTVTDDGRAALRARAVRVLRDVPRFVARVPQQVAADAPAGASSYTSNPARAVDHLEALADPAVRWGVVARERHAASLSGRQRARRIRRMV